MDQGPCSHANPQTVRDVKPSANGCEECLKIGSSWVHLRECLECGHVGCCDSSAHKHATKHFQSSAPPDHAFGRTRRRLEVLLRR